MAECFDKQHHAVIKRLKRNADILSEAAPVLILTLQASSVTTTLAMQTLNVLYCSTSTTW